MEANMAILKHIAASVLGLNKGKMGGRYVWGGLGGAY